MAEYGVVLFHSTSHAIRAEKVLMQAGVTIKMIPTPRQLSSDCGMALRFDRTDKACIVATLEENQVPINGIHVIAQRI
jgi:hypothetical protein